METKQTLEFLSNHMAKIIDEYEAFKQNPTNSAATLGMLGGTLKGYKQTIDELLEKLKTQNTQV